MSMTQETAADLPSMTEAFRQLTEVGAFDPIKTRVKYLPSICQYRYQKRYRTRGFLDPSYIRVKK